MGFSFLKVNSAWEMCIESAQWAYRGMEEGMKGKLIELATTRECGERCFFVPVFFFAQVTSRYKSLVKLNLAATQARVQYSNSRAKKAGITSTEKEKWENHVPLAVRRRAKLFLCAVKFIRRLETQGIDRGDSVVLGQLQPHLAAITMVALSMSGIASIPAEAVADVNNSLASAIITEIHFPGIDLPVIDPPQYGSDNDSSTEEILWPRLPEIRGEEQFMFDTTSGTFASNADILAALLKDYKSISSGNMQVLYADQRVDSRMLGMIWQTLFVSVTEVHES